MEQHVTHFSADARLLIMNIEDKSRLDGLLTAQHVVRQWMECGRVNVWGNYDPAIPPHHYLQELVAFATKKVGPLPELKGQRRVTVVAMVAIIALLLSHGLPFEISKLIPIHGNTPTVGPTETPPPPPFTTVPLHEIHDEPWKLYDGALRTQFWLNISRADNKETELLHMNLPGKVELVMTCNINSPLAVSLMYHINDMQNVNHYELGVLQLHQSYIFSVTLQPTSQVEIDLNFGRAQFVHNFTHSSDTRDSSEPPTLRFGSRNPGIAGTIDFYHPHKWTAHVPREIEAILNAFNATKQKAANCNATIERMQQMQLLVDKLATIEREQRWLRQKASEECAGIPGMAGEECYNARKSNATLDTECNDILEQLKTKYQLEVKHVPTEQAKIDTSLEKCWREHEDLQTLLQNLSYDIDKQVHSYRLQLDN